MKPTTLLLLLLAFALGAAPLAAQAVSSEPPVVTAPPVPGGEPAFLTPAVSPTPGALPGRPLDGVRFLVDEECEAMCFQQYFECANGCSACDQCSCQLALCRAGCGVPYTGC